VQLIRLRYGFDADAAFTAPASNTADH
jgi:hypothetical protein